MKRVLSFLRRFLPGDALEGEDGYRRLRPVGMALLPHELRAVRARQLGWVAIGLVVFGASAFALVRLTPLRRLLPGSLRAAQTATHAPSSAELPAPVATHALIGDATLSARAPAVATATTAAASEEPLPAGAASSSIRQVGRAQGFRNALLSAGASAEESGQLVAALGKLIDFRRVRPNDDLIFARDGSGQLLSFEYRASATERVRAERAPDGAFKAARVDVKHEFRRAAKGGYINDSLAKALENLGLRITLLGAFVEAFEGRIDFKKHMRQGDTFRLIIDEEFIEGQPTGGGRVHALQYQGSQTGSALAFWFDGGQKGGDFYDENGRGMHGGWLRTPLRYSHISSRYNLKRRHPILKRIIPHLGIDYAAPPGTTVWAAADGVVSFVGRRGGSGNLVSLRHSGGYESFYAHLSRPAVGLRPGGRVRQRQAIGLVGSTGRSTGPHLHFALKRGGRFVDPATQLNGPGKILAESLLPRFKQQAAALKRELATIELAAAPAEPTPQQPEPEADEDFREEALDL